MYIVNSPIKVGGKRYVIGSPLGTADLTEAVATALLASGHLVRGDGAGYEAASAETRAAVERLLGPGWDKAGENEAARREESEQRAREIADELARVEADRKLRESSEGSKTATNGNEGDGAHKAPDASANGGAGGSTTSTGDAAQEAATASDASAKAQDGKAAKADPKKKR